MKDKNVIQPSNPKRILYTYWETIPLTKKIDFLTNKMGSQPVRKFLLSYIRQGKEDEYSKTNNIRKRHAFTAHELYTAYKEEMTDQQDNKFTVQNIHFHLKKLLEADLVYVVASIVEGNHRVKYYGRTAKMTVVQDVEELYKQEQKIAIDTFTKLLTKLNPNVSEDKIIRLLNKTFEAKINLMKNIIFPWLEEYYDLTYDSNVDLNYLSEYLSGLSTIDRGTIQLLKTLARMFKLPIDIDLSID